MCLTHHFLHVARTACSRQGSRGNDAPVLQQELLQFRTVDADRALAEANSWQIAGLNQYVAARERDLQLLSRFPYRNSGGLFLSVHVDLPTFGYAYMDTKPLGPVLKQVSGQKPVVGRDPLRLGGV